MRKLIIIFLLVIICLWSCERAENSSYQACDYEHFYYTYDEKYYIDTLLQNDFLLIGFHATSSYDDINSFLQESSLFTSDSLSIIYNSDYIQIIKRFIKPQTCFEINDIIKDLEVNEIVSFAAHCYKGEFCFGFDCTELMSYSNEFVVSLNDSSDINNLHGLCEDTNTWISEHSEYYFVIRVDKNSQGNALEMANFFYESGLFHYSHPNFHYFNIE